MRVNKHQSPYILSKPDASEVEKERGSCNARSSEGKIGGKEARDARGGCSIGRELRKRKRAFQAHMHVNKKTSHNEK